MDIQVGPIPIQFVIGLALMKPTGALEVQSLWDT